MPALPSIPAAGNGDDLATTARESPATADNADAGIGKAPSVSGAYIYGYDSAGNPTLADGSSSSSDGR